MDINIRAVQIQDAKGIHRIYTCLENFNTKKSNSSALKLRNWAFLLLRKSARLLNKNKIPFLNRTHYRR